MEEQSGIKSSLFGLDVISMTVLPVILFTREKEKNPNPNGKRKNRVLVAKKKMLQRCAVGWSDYGGK